MRTITIKEIEGINFKNHENIVLEFGTLNTIKGMNGEGKSSIGEIFSWVLGGVDMMGWSKFDPTPTDRAADKVFGSVLLKVDDKDIKFAREIVKGKMAYYINDVPKKAKEFMEVVYSLTGSDSIDLLLSLFNPSYFPAMHWQDQRNMIMRHMSEPASATVFKALPKLQADGLKAAFKKHDIKDLDALHKKNKVNKEKELIAARATLQTLEGQFKGVAVNNVENLEAEDKGLRVELLEQEKQHEKFMEYQQKLGRLKNVANTLLDRIESIKTKNTELKEQVDCPACNQVLSTETKQNVKDGLTAEYKPLVAEYKTKFAELSELVEIEDWNLVRVKEIEARRSVIVGSIQVEKNRLKAVETVEAARAKVDEVQASLNESIFLLDAIKAYNAKAAEIQSEDVRKLFKTLSIRLWNTPKEGDKTPAFEIEMNGKPYSKLSLGERAVAGAELIGVLMEQLDIYSTVFFDNAESITRSVSGLVNENTPQIIAAYAAPQTFDKDGIMTYDGILKVEVI